jgi:hypothetical protein
VIVSSDGEAEMHSSRFFSGTILTFRVSLGFGSVPTSTTSVYDWPIISCCGSERCEMTTGARTGTRPSKPDSKKRREPDTTN